MGRRTFLGKAAWAALAGAAGTLSLAPSALAAGKLRTVIIDAGHGGHDLGANEGRVFEKHLNLDVCRRMDIQLRRMGYKTIMTRDRDEFIPLLTRSVIANRYKESIFVSVHFNSSWKTSAFGIETYYCSYAGFQLANLIHNGMIRKLKAEDRGVKRAQFSVLRNTRSPAVLVEGGFVSNAKERQRMLQPWYRQSLSESVCAGIQAYDEALQKGKV